MKPTIGIMAPSYAVTEQDIAPGLAILKSWGFKVQVHPACFETYGSMAGTDTRRAQAVMETITDPAIDIVMAACGGHGCFRIVDQLDFKELAKHKKPLFGYSDFTVLLNAFQQHGFPVFHSPMLKRLEEVDDDSQAMLKATLIGEQEAIAAPFANLLRYASAFKSGTAEGMLIGGNLAAFAGMLGTDYIPQHKNLILCVEDINEVIFRLDRKFSQLRLSGIMDRVRGLIVGEILNIEAADTPFGFTLPELIRHHFGNLDIPVIYDVPCGHGARKMTLPFGANCTLEVADDRITWELGQHG